MRNIVSPLEGIRSPFGPRYGAFSPASLFAAGEQGVWYDPSDFTTMFQDSAGTTPVTAVEQPVRLLLDKSQGLVLGSELVDTANTAAAWTVYGTNTVTQDGDAVKVTYVNDTQGAFFYMTASGGLSTNLTIGKTYLFTCQVRASGGTVSVAPLFFNGSSSGAGSVAVSSADYTTVTFRLLEYTGGAPFVRLQTPVGTIGWIKSISVKLLSGNHATQSTNGAQPTLSARVNQLTYSEQFDNAAWTKFSATVTQNSTVAPDGTITADTLTATTSTGYGATTAVVANAAGSYTQSISAKRGNKDWAVFFCSDAGANYSAMWVNLNTGALGTVKSVGTFSGAVGTIIPQDNGFYRLTLSFTKPATASSNACYCASVSGDDSFTRLIGETITIWGADLRPTNQTTLLPAYQRIAAATDYDTTGFPYYLRFDGTDDSMVTGTITPGIDKAQVFAGVRKQSDATIAFVYEFSSNSNDLNGSFGLYSGLNSLQSGAGAYPAVQSRGTIRTFTPIGTPYAAPVTLVHTLISDIAAPVVTQRINGTQDATSTASQGTGNFLAYPLYIGSRAGTSSRLNGNLYSLIVRFGSNLDATTISNTETWVNGKTRAY